VGNGKIGNYPRTRGKKKKYSTSKKKKRTWLRKEINKRRVGSRKKPRAAVKKKNGMQIKKRESSELFSQRFRRGGREKRLTTGEGKVVRRTESNLASKRSGRAITKRNSHSRNGTLHVEKGGAAGSNFESWAIKTRGRCGRTVKNAETVDVAQGP